MGRTSVAILRRKSRNVETGWGYPRLAFLRFLAANLLWIGCDVVRGNEIVVALILSFVEVFEEE